MKIDKERNQTDFHIHYYPDKVLRARESNGNQDQFDLNTNLTIQKIIDSKIKYVGIVGRAGAGTQAVTEEIKRKLEAFGVSSIFGMEYHSLLPERFRTLTPTGLLDLVCLGFDHDAQDIKDLYSSERNAKLAVKQIDKLKEMGFNLEPKTDQQKAIIDDMVNGKVVNKNDFLAQLIAELDAENKSKILELEKKYGPITPNDRKENGFSPLKNWLWRLLFRASDGIAFEYYQTQTDKLIEIVHQAGGVVLYSPEEKFNDEIFGFLLNNNIDGVMGWHGGKLEEVPKNWICVLRKMGKLVMGGSDFDPVKNDWQPGVGRGQMFLSLRRGKEFFEYLAKQKDKNGET